MVSSYAKQLDGKKCKLKEKQNQGLAKFMSNPRN
jgi:hypothetical protein